MESPAGTASGLPGGWRERAIPLSAQVLRRRPVAALLAGLAALQLGLVAGGLSGWPCPLREGLGIPCPGCGLSRAVVELLRGEWRASLSHHAFAPLLLAGVAALAAASLLPERLRLRLIVGFDRLERRTRLSGLVLIGLVVYWIARWTFARETLLLLGGRQP
jgi:hypothetical protein